MYINLDGDDIGRKISCCYMTEDEKGLRRVISRLSATVSGISQLLEGEGFSIVVCAADGIVARTEKEAELGRLFGKIRELAAPDFTFSVGVGASLRESYLALLYAKSSGKDSLSEFSAIPTAATSPGMRQ